ncbi:hypothetical protein B0H10DRAFT_2199977 [Mycena sp. CBHHK59/15]|nr:hypothetical protein B0H10DRAFT_2199977 [Mycena sp. CBHHK59/15]
MFRGRPVLWNGQDSLAAALTWHGGQSAVMFRLGCISQGPLIIPLDPRSRFGQNFGDLDLKPRKGKDYSDDLPWEVIQAKNAVFKLPAPVVGRIPAGNVPVTEFAALALPHQSSELAYGESQL